MLHARLPHDSSSTPYPTDAELSTMPWDPYLITHITLMLLAYGVIFPLGFLFALAKSKKHSPTQIVGSLVAGVAFIMGHRNRTKYFPHNPHKRFQGFMLWILIMQVGLGVMLKLTKGGSDASSSSKILQFLRSIRSRILRPAHVITGWSFVLLPYIQAIFGLIALTRTCGGDEVINCVAHFIMGSFFVYYGSVTVLRHYGAIRLPFRMDVFDSILITLWGFINAFFEHRPGTPWNHTDMQHTSSGILWLSAGLLSLLLTFYPPYAKSTLNIIPALVIVFTGVQMAMHAQHSVFSSTVHCFFGGALVVSGLLRVWDLYLTYGRRRDGGVGRDGKDDNGDTEDARTLQNHAATPTSLHLPTGLFLILSGVLFMSGNSTAVMWAESAHIDPVSYSAVGVAIAFGVVGYVLGLLAVVRVVVGGKASGGEEGGVGRRGKYASLNGDGDGEEEEDGLDGETMLEEEMGDGVGRHGGRNGESGENGSRKDTTLLFQLGEEEREDEGVPLRRL
ncbi:hypothetical protein HDV00_009182 [Rhizophlyctis rosea]|nr:hypothetical protein HDV00_009182 [Rhizophlyctis rosea]